MTAAGTLKALAAGVAGACALTALHETTRRVAPHPPRLDILGMRAIAKSVRATRHDPPERLHRTALLGDLAANTAFYSLVASAGPRKALITGSVLGLSAGLGALLLPKPLGLGTAPSNRTTGTQAMALGLYLAGGLIAAATYKRLKETEAPATA